MRLNEAVETHTAQDFKLQMCVVEPNLKNKTTDNYKIRSATTTSVMPTADDKELPQAFAFARIP